MAHITSQEVFDAALFGVRGQDYRRSFQHGSCRYRGPGQDKCGIGHSLPDSLVEKTGDIDSIQGLMERYDEVREFYQLVPIGLLQAVQQAHDIDLGEGPDCFEWRMRQIAEHWGLTYTPVQS